MVGGVNLQSRSNVKNPVADGLVGHVSVQQQKARRNKAEYVLMLRGIVPGEIILQTRRCRGLLAGRKWHMPSEMPFRRREGGVNLQS